MTRATPTAALAIVSAQAVVGLGLLFAGFGARARADDVLLRVASGTVSRIRDVDRIALSAHRRDAQAISDLDDALRQAVEPGEADVLGWARACLAPGGECAAHPMVGLERVRQYYADRLERRWSAAHRQRLAAAWLIGIGLCLCAGSLATAGLFVRRAGAKGDAEPRAPERATVEQTMRRRLEELYAARLRAWQSDRFAVAGEIAAGLSHGLKTPLASIRAAAQLAQMKLTEDHPAARQLEDILEEADSLVEQVRRFLHATGAANPVPSRLPPAQLVEALEREYKSRAQDQGLTWQTQVEQDLLEVCVDPGLLEMACRNLIENAFAVAPPGSKVTVTARSSTPPPRAGLDELPPTGGRWIEIAVHDHGPGIQVPAGATVAVPSQKSGGSGLGLAIARRIVARHGGALLFDSSAGTTARVLLPAWEPSRVTEAPP
jgi:signal transduction histidine kinase